MNFLLQQLCVILRKQTVTANHVFFAARRVCMALKNSQRPLSAQGNLDYMGQSYGRSHGRIEQRLFERIIEVCTSKKWLTKHGTKEITYEASRTLNRGAWLNGEIEDFMDQFSSEESKRLVMGNIELKEGIVIRFMSLLIFLKIDVD
ncbi:hypothetical protein [Endozoicomonas atrinae]|uniref:hypothetical protein n=1 Tax=Endozoicomonas atrinae TaxID=1333660 RepID=UPI00082658EB|nr:hypothetical protein [Endozoicomonas atrinae]